MPWSSLESKAAWLCQGEWVRLLLASMPHELTPVLPHL